MKKPILLLLALATLFPWSLRATTPPRLIVEVVVGSMRAEELDRYEALFGEGGFRRLTKGGVRYTEATYGFQQTLTPVTLATLTTGARPALHGIVGSRWCNHTTTQSEALIEDPASRGLDYPDDGCNYSPHRLIAPTLGDALRSATPGSRSVALALEAESSVVTGGRQGIAFWLHPLSCDWTSSSHYLLQLPAWVRSCNRENLPQSYLTSSWQTLHPEERYHNRLYATIQLQHATKSRERRAGTSEQEPFRRIESLAPHTTRYDQLLYSPAGNTFVLEFAKRTITQMELGREGQSDLLVITLDAARRVTEAYGPESVEVEDMYYRLDRDLSDFLTFLDAQFDAQEVLVVLTSDHGTSPSFDAGARPTDRFNARQFEVIVNGFLSARYGQEQWVVDYEAGNLYLNHERIFEKKLSLTDLCNEVATFAMQFRGVSHALTAPDLRGSYFGGGYAGRMQEGFYPRRSGDVVIALMPEWMEQRDHIRSSSGSMYRYDRHVPLIFYGAGLTAQQIDRAVDMTSVAPTLARLWGIAPPAASEGEVLSEVVTRPTPHK